MRFLYDTDHISILQRGTQPDQSNIRAHAAQYLAGDFACSIVSFEEQTRGANAFIRAARQPAEVVRRYHLLEMVLKYYAAIAVLPFDGAAAAVLSRLRTGGVKIGTRDLRIASIALARRLVVLTRNARDFANVPGLVIEDWTV